jgi:hypothetical protein
MNRYRDNQFLIIYLVHQKNNQLHAMSNKLANNSSGKLRSAWLAVTADVV